MCVNRPTAASVGSAPWRRALARRQAPSSRAQGRRADRHAASQARARQKVKPCRSRPRPRTLGCGGPSDYRTNCRDGAAYSTLTVSHGGMTVAGVSPISALGARDPTFTSSNGGIARAWTGPPRARSSSRARQDRRPRCRSSLLIQLRATQPARRDRVSLRDDGPPAKVPTSLSCAESATSARLPRAGRYPSSRE